MNLRNRIRDKRDSTSLPPDLFKNEDGAIDLASIMVGIIVIGLIGGVIASTVFVVIPWTQDNAAKQQLDSIVSAESAYFGLSADNPPALPAGAKANTFGNSAELAAAKLMQTGVRYCVTTPADGKSYDAYSQSSSGAIFTVTDRNSKPVPFTGGRETLPTDCQFIADGINSTPVSTPTASTPAPYVDPTPKITSLTFQCVGNTWVDLPMDTNLKGTATWSDSPAVRTYNGVTKSDSKLLQAGTKYSVTFDGTYTNFNSNNMGSAAATDCLVSLDHWGSGTGVTNAYNAFGGADNLVDVPASIPATITSIALMFNNATKINDPDISTWDVSNVKDMTNTFNQARAFNQPLNGWNISNVRAITGMFFMADKFNQPLDKWDTSNLTNLTFMFAYTKAFNQPLDSWKTSKVTVMDSMFSSASAFNQDLNSWDTSQVTNMNQVFYDAVKFNGNVTAWNVAKVTLTKQMMYNTSFSYDLHNWTTTALPVGNGSQFASASFPTGYLPPKTAK